MNPSLDALRAIWPREPGAEEIAVWASLSKAHRDLAARRLSTVLAYEEGGGRDAATHATDCGLSLPRFFSLLRAWRQEPSLLSLVPQARGRARGGATVPEEVEAAVREAVLRAAEDDQDDDAPSRESIATALHRRFERPSIGTFRKLVARTMRDAEREQAGGFGRSVVIDSAALPLPLATDRTDGEAADFGEDGTDVEWAVTALCWDRATGRILGRALGRAPSSMSLHAAAAGDAATALRRMDRSGLEGAHADARAEVVTTLPLDEDAMGKLRIIDAMEREGARVIRVHRGEGAELMKSFGGRLGRLDLRPRFAAGAFPGRSSRAEMLARYGRLPMSRDEALLALDLEIGVHNEAADAIDFALAARPDLVADDLDRVFGGLSAAPDRRLQHRP